MTNSIEEKLDAAIKACAEAAAKSGLKSDDALRYTQAALNAAHTLQVVKGTQVN